MSLNNIFLGHLTSGLKGGVKLCKTPAEIESFTQQMIGFNLITQQTRKEGLKVNAVLVHEAVDIDRQIYLAFILDRKTQGLSLVASKFGGMEIEEVAKTHPESIIVHPINITVGFLERDAIKIANELDLGEEPFLHNAVEQMQRLYKMFLKNDCVQVEIKNGLNAS